MRGDYSENIYWDEVQMLDMVMDNFNKMDIQANKRVTGKIRKDVMIKTLRKVFPLKTDIRFNRLKRTLAKEDCAQGSVVGYVSIFSEDKDGNQGPFAEALRDQHAEEREEYLDDIREGLEKVAVSGVDESGEEV